MSSSAGRTVWRAGSLSPYCHFIKFSVLIERSCFPCIAIEMAHEFYTGKEIEEIVCGSRVLEWCGFFSKHQNVPRACPKASANVRQTGNVKIEKSLFILLMQEGPRYL
jgi:hypothetical protein